MHKTREDGVNNSRLSYRLKPIKRLAILSPVCLLLLHCDLFDITPPEIEIISPVEGELYFGAIPLEVKATDNRSVEKVEVLIDGEAVHEFTKSPYKTNISLDQYSASTSVNLKAIAHDQAGNSADASRDVNVTIGLRLTAPNGGETWPENSTQTITWESSGDVGGSVGLNYSVDNGDTWQELISSTPNDGSYDWQIPNFTESASKSRIKISTSQYEDFSDSVFTIAANPNYITLTAPNGGENWAEQSTQNITWNFSGDVGDNVSLNYSLDNGVTWTQISASTSNNGSHPWTLPNLFETVSTCRVRVNSTTTSFGDTTNTNFTIAAEPNIITVTSPNGGEVWAEQSSQTITWTSSGDVGNNVDLHYSLDAGDTWTEIITSTPNDGSYSWTLPNLFETATTCRLRINSTTTSFGDTSNAEFTITAEPNFTLTSPNGGESWYERSSHAILWDASDDVGDYISLDFSVDGGTIWQTIVSSAENDGSYLWITPHIAETTTACRIRVASTSASFADSSDNDFTLASRLIGSVSTYGGQDVHVREHIAYIANYSSRSLQVIDASDALNPHRIAGISLPGFILKVFVNWDFAYVAARDSGMHIVDVSDPTNPEWIGTWETSNLTLDIHVFGNYAYVADWSGGLKVIDISDAANPQLIGSLENPPGGVAIGIFKYSDYVYLASASPGIHIIDVSVPTSPQLIASCDPPGNNTEGVFISDGIAYITDAVDSGLQIIDVSDPANPQLVGSWGTGSYDVADVFALGGYYAFVASGSSGLQVIDISDPTTPQLLGSWDTPGFAGGVFYDYDYDECFLLDNTALLIFDMSGLP